MRISAVLVAAMAVGIGAASAQVGQVWSCSVVDNGKPQVVKLTVGKAAVSVSDWRTRLMDEMIPDNKHSYTLRLIADTKDVLVGNPNVTKEVGQRSDVTTEMFAINRCRVLGLPVVTAGIVERIALQGTGADPRYLLLGLRAGKLDR
jgi:hypothetical protein